MKYNEVKSLSKQDLKKQVTELRKANTELKIKAGLGRLENPSVIKKNRVIIARLLTALNLTA